MANKAFKRTQKVGCANFVPLNVALGVHGGSVQVVYKNNLDDLIALNIDLFSSNAQYKKRKLWSLYGTPLFLLFAFSFFAYVTGSPSFYGGAVVGSLFSFFLDIICL